MRRRELEQRAGIGLGAVSGKRVGRSGRAILVGILIQQCNLCADTVVGDGNSCIGARCARACHVADSCATRELKICKVDAIAGGKTRDRAGEALGVLKQQSAERVEIKVDVLGGRGREFEQGARAVVLGDVRGDPDASGVLRGAHLFRSVGLRP